MSVMEVTCQSSCVRAAICVPGVASASLAGVIIQLASAPLATTEKKAQLRGFISRAKGRAGRTLAALA